jgi:tetratricopeptide (TPR) repeat protein
MRLSAAALFAAIAIAALPAGSMARADESANPQEQAPQDPGSQDKPQEAAPQQTPAELRADLYSRLAASADSDETDGLVGLLTATYAQSGSDTGDLLLQRARKAMGEKEYDAAGEILDQTVALLPDWAEGWNARATLRYLDDDLDGSMADIAETLKREPRHLGALMGMSHILEARDKKEEALKVCERVLAIAPHWRSAETTAERLKAAIAGQEL